MTVVVKDHFPKKNIATPKLLTRENQEIFCECSKCTAEKAMAPHSSTPAWKIPWTEEPGGLPSMGSHRVRHDRSDLAAAAAVDM